MTALVRQNRRWLGALLTLAMAVMTTAAGATWQCADGRPCPPRCMMQAEPPAPAPREGGHGCCKPKADHCGLCVGERHLAAAPTDSCSLSSCELRFLPKPDAALQSHSHPVPENAADLPTAPPLPQAEASAQVFARPGRAPPGDRQVPPPPARAPPTLPGLAPRCLCAAGNAVASCHRTNC